MKITTALKIITSASALMSFTGQAAAATEFYFTSSPTSWVGEGQTVSVSPSSGFYFTPSRTFDNGASFTIYELATDPEGQYLKLWNLDFSAPFGENLSVGNYDDASRWPFHEFSKPGLALSSNFRGSNTLTGSFKILEVSYAASGDILTFAADFMQYEDGIKDDWVGGSIRYNSSIAISTIPEPGSTMLFCAGVGVLVTFGRRGQSVRR